MKRLLLLLLLASSALGQVVVPGSGTPSVTVPAGTSTKVLPRNCTGTDKFSAVDAGGNLTCSADLAGTSAAAGGNNTELQFNDSGVMGGIPGATYLKASTELRIKTGAFFSFIDSADATKKAQLDLSGISVGATRTGRVPDVDFGFVIPFTCTNQAVTAAAASGNFTCTTLGKTHLPAVAVYTDQGNTYSTGTQDFEAASVTRPFRRLANASFPGSCTANREFLERSDPAVAGQVLYVCNSGGNGWNLVGDGGAIGGINTEVLYNNSGAIGGITNDLSGYCLTSNGVGVVPSFQPCGAGAGANVALSNLAAVSINASLAPQTTLSVGDSTHPWQFVWLYGAGTYGANNQKVTSTAPTGARVFTLPDADSNPVRPDTGAANNFLTAIASTGVISKAQPAFTNLSGAASDAQVPDSIALSQNVIADWQDWTEIAAPASPAAGKARVYAKSASGELCAKSSGGAETCMSTGSGGGGATTALDNLAAVSINQGLTPQTTLSLGDSARPWQFVWVYGAGTYGINNQKITSTAPTGARIFTLPDADSNPVRPDAGAANNFLTAIASTGIISKAQPAFSNLSGSATCAQLPAFTGDVTTVAGNCANTAVNLPDGVTQAGHLLLTNIAAPTSPAAGKVKVFTDSTDLRFHDKNASGAIGTTVVADAGTANNFLTAISVAGAISKAQPIIGNLAAFTSAALAAVVSDETGGTSKLVFDTSPAIITPSFTTGFTIGGVATSGQIVRGNGTNFVAVDDIRSLTYIQGADNATSVAADDQLTFWRNNLGRTYRITEVWCESDAGTPTVNLQRDDGSPANVLSSDLTCTTGGATGTIAAAEQDVASGDKLDFLSVTPGGTAKRTTVNIKLVAQ